MKTWLRILVASIAAFALGEGRAADFTFGFQGCPEKIIGAPGEEKRFDAFLTLTTSNNPTTDGAQGWSLSIGCDGGEIKAITLKGVTVDTIYDEDQDLDPATPPIHHEHYAEDLGDPAIFTKVAALGFHSENPARKGAISGVLLRGQEWMVLQPTGTQTVAKITVSAIIPPSGVGSVSLFYEDGFQSVMSQPVVNVVTVRGVSNIPTLGSCRVLLGCACPTFGLAVVPAGKRPPEFGDFILQGIFPPGDVLIPVDVLLSTSYLPQGDGPQGWSLSILNENCMEVDAVTLKGVTVNTIYDEDDDLDPSTPPIHHENYVQDLGAASVFTKLAQKATGAPPSPFNDPEVKGVISAVVLRGMEKMNLHANATDTILRIIYKLHLTDGETKECKVSIVDGLKSVLSQPVVNVITYDGLSMAPSVSQGLIIRATGGDATPQFIRGDANNDRRINIADAIRVVLAVIPSLDPGGIYAIPCRDAGDADGNGRLELPDAIYLIDHQFRGGSNPLPPYPRCGTSVGTTWESCPMGSTTCTGGE